MRANILCAGFGTRLRPFTYLKPKPLLNIGGYPLVERTIRQLHADGDRFHLCGRLHDALRG